MEPTPGKFTAKRWLTIVSVLAFALRLPGLFWGELHKDQLLYLEPDEIQHTELAIHFLQKLDPALFRGFETKRLNTLGLSVQMALAGYPVIKFGGDSAKVLLITGRLLGILYGVLTVLLVYRMAVRFFGNEMPALLAAGGMALFDLGVTYSHYAVPESAYVFWVFFAIYQVMLIFEKWESTQGTPRFKFNKILPHWLWMALAMGMTLGMKLDFIPLLLLVVGISIPFLNSKISFRATCALLLGSFAAVFFFFKISIGFQTGWSGILKLFHWLVAENNNLIERDSHYLYNPLLYLTGTVAGIGVPAALVAAYGFVSRRFFWRKIPTIPVTVLLLFVLMEFLVLWKLDAPFVRRCTVFLPFVALLFGAGAWSLLQKNTKTGRLLLGSVAVYTLLLTLVSQWNFVEDNRFAARDYLRQAHFAGKAIYIDSYASVPGMPRSVSFQEAEIIVMHETRFSRYWKSFTTPFMVPACCEEVYHCNQEECELYQKLLSGNPEYGLVKKFTPVDWAPERLLFKHYFGTYETFLGDVLIFEKRS
jgi:hypothetical protein